MRSLRSRLLVAMIVSLAFLLVLFGTMLYVSIRRSLIAEMDASLLVAAHNLPAMMEIEHGRVRLRERKTAVPETLQRDSTRYRLWITGGEAPTPEVGESSLPQFHGDGAQPEYRFLSLADGRVARAIGMSLPLPGRLPAAGDIKIAKTKSTASTRV